MAQVTTRQATERDLEALVALRTEMFVAMGMSDGEASWRDEARAWFAARLDDDRYHLAVVEADGAVVACAMGAVRDAAPSPGNPQGRDVLISNVCTSAGQRGRGYGQAAFDAVMTWARQVGVGRAELMATDAGQAMYERAGFRRTAMPAMRAPLR